MVSNSAKDAEIALEDAFDDYDDYEDDDYYEDDLYDYLEADDIDPYYDSDEFRREDDFYDKG